MYPYTHPMYICDRCGWGHYHPLSYCVKCPGRLYRKDIPHLQSAKTIEENREFLSKQGVKYEGEYLKIPRQDEIKILIERYKEQLLKRQLECCFNYVNNENHQLHPERPVMMWKQEIKKLEQELQELEKGKDNVKATT